MKYPVSLATAFVLSIPSLAIAQDCKTAQETIIVSSPEDLDIFRDGCTTITGNIEISHNYVDDFFLDKVTDIVGNISIPDVANPGTLGVLDLPDLVKAGAITLHQTTGVNLPKLERAGDIFLNPWTSGTVDLRNLREADSISVKNGWRSIDLSSLETVHGMLEFSNPNSSSIFPADQLPRLEIALPALKRTRSLEAGGYAASFSAPELEVIGLTGPSEEDRYQGSFSVSFHDHIEVEFPKLHTLTGSTLIMGNITRISLPALGKTDAGFEFNTEEPVEIYSSLETAAHFWLWGKIKSIELPNMVDLGSVSFANPIWPCNETLVKIWETVPDYGSSGEGRCTREDLPEENPDPSGEEGSGGVDTDTDTPPESGSGSEAVDETENQDVPGDTGAFLAPPQFGGAGMLLVAVVAYVLHA
ncbi:hypothetical protein BJY04DRAFT_203835 [Aspergillus karnatakaensis]|uniref:uncharacterized protein n=1 Tax=Aspergillus karnatakaensis TaxID=1810916 RepID=UPI003CCDF890